MWTTADGLLPLRCNKLDVPTAPNWPRLSSTSRKSRSNSACCFIVSKESTRSSAIARTSSGIWLEGGEERSWSASSPMPRPGTIAGVALVNLMPLDLAHWCVASRLQFSQPSSFPLRMSIVPIGCWMVWSSFEERKQGPTEANESILTTWTSVIGESAAHF